MEESTQEGNKPKVANKDAWKYLSVMLVMTLVLISLIIWQYNCQSNPCKIDCTAGAKCSAENEIILVSASSDTSSPFVYVVRHDTITSLRNRVSPLLLNYVQKFGKKDTVNKRATGKDSSKSTESPTIYMVPKDSLKSFAELNYAPAGNGGKCCWGSLLFLVALCGALGAMAYILQSFTDYWGNGELEPQWLGFYVVKPFIGSGLALAFYFVWGANMLGKPDPGNSLNYVLALSFLVGMFTDKASKKMSDVFEILLSPRDDRQGKLSQVDATVTITGTSPDKVVSAADTSVTITGKGFKADMKVVCDKGVVTNVVITPGDSGSIKFNLKTTAPANSSIHINITDGSGAVKATTTISVT